MTDTAWAFIIGAFYIAIIYMLVRPNSPGPQLVNTVAAAMAALVKGVIT
jgi:uncharacterized membrane protein